MPDYMSIMIKQRLKTIIFFVLFPLSGYKDINIDYNMNYKWYDMIYDMHYIFFFCFIDKSHGETVYTLVNGIPGRFDLDIL